MHVHTFLGLAVLLVNSTALWPYVHNTLISLTLIICRGRCLGTLAS